MVAFKRLAVHRISDDQNRLVVILQYPGLDTGPSILVAPLFPKGELSPMPPVTVDIEIDGEGYILAVQQLSTFPRDYVGPEVGNLTDHEYEISCALSRLFFGN